MTLREGLGGANDISTVVKLLFENGVASVVPPGPGREKLLTRENVLGVAGIGRSCTGGLGVGVISAKVCEGGIVVGNMGLRASWSGGGSLIWEGSF